MKKKFGLIRLMLISLSCFLFQVTQAQTSQEFVDYGIDRLNAKDFELAMNYFTQAVQLDSNNSRAHAYLGKMYAARYNFNEAAPHLDRSIALDGRPDAYLTRALVFMNLRDFESALSDLSNAYDSLKNNSEFYFVRAGCYMLKKSYKAAVDDYDKLIELKPKEATYFYLRGLVHQELNESELACQDFRKAKEMKYSGADKMIKEYCKQFGY